MFKVRTAERAAVVQVRGRVAVSVVSSTRSRPSHARGAAEVSKKFLQQKFLRSF